MGQQTPPALDRVTEIKSETSFKEVLANIKEWVAYLKTKWLWILLVGLIFGIAAFFYSKKKVPLYIAESTFVLDEDNGSKSSAGLSALGLGIGGKSAGFFTATDNIIWLYSTRLMLQKTLLSTVDTQGKKVLLINWFLAESGIKKAMDKNPAQSKVRFDPGVSDTALSREQNALITNCANLIRGKYLKVQLTPKTENVVSVSFKSKDEQFSAAFINELVANVNDYYIQTKVKKAKDEVALLESKAAQYKSEMSSSMYEVAEGYDDAPYANPNRLVLKVAPQRRQVDAKISAEIYGGLVQQLELSRTNLQKQMPLIQIIEQPVLPLNVEGSKPVFAAIVGFVAGGFITLLVFAGLMAYRKLING